MTSHVECSLFLFHRFRDLSKSRGVSANFVFQPFRIQDVNFWNFGDKEIKISISHRRCCEKCSFGFRVKMNVFRHLWKSGRSKVLCFDRDEALFEDLPSVFAIGPKVCVRPKSEWHFYTMLKFTPHENDHFACVFDHRRWSLSADVTKAWFFI